LLDIKYQKINIQFWQRRPNVTSLAALQFAMNQGDLTTGKRTVSGTDEQSCPLSR